MGNAQHDERDEAALSIGEVSAMTGTPITTLRYYEQRGLIDPPQRVGGKRRYGRSVLMRLMLIKFCRIAGIKLDDVGRVVRDRSADRRVVKEIARERVTAIDEQLERLRLARSMMDAASRCTCTTVENCVCGSMAPVIEQVLDSDLDWT